MCEINHPKLTEEVFNEIFEHLIGDKLSDRVYITDKIKDNAINYRFAGYITIDDIDYTFDGRDGDWNGSELLSFEEDRSVPKLDKTVLITIPVPYTIEELSNKYDKEFSEKEYQFYLQKFEINKDRMAEICRKYDYDRYFCPSYKVEKHYKELMDFKTELQEVERE